MKMRVSARFWQFLLLGMVLFLREEVNGEKGDTDVNGLLRELGADDYATRKGAQDKLYFWGKEDLRKRVDFLRAVQRDTEDPEVQERCREIVRDLVSIVLDKERPGFMGISMGVQQVRLFGEKPEVPRGVEILAIIEDTSAEKFGLREGDLILKIDDLDLSGHGGSDRLRNYVGGMRTGDDIEVHIERGEEKLTIPLTLMPRPMELDLNTRRRLAAGADFDAELTELEKAELARIRERAIEKWLQDNELENSDG